MDRLGDVVLSGPLVRAVAAGAERVIYLASPAGAAAARLLPGVDQVVVQRAGWIEAERPPVNRAAALSVVDDIARLHVDEAVVLTSFHQSPLPLALLLRMAGVRRIGAISVDFPGSLLDVRHAVDDDVHEVERALSLGSAMGYRLPAGDDGALRITGYPPVIPVAPSGGYIAVHPGASVAARAWDPDRHAAAVAALAEAGWHVVVTGGRHERALTAKVAGDRGADLGGRLDVAGLAGVLAGAQVLVAGNTGPAHLAAAVGTPVLSLYAPTVPASRWRPWKVPHILLGNQGIGCAGCRAVDCPVPGHPCLAGIDATAVVAGVAALAGPGLAAPAALALGEAG